MTTIPNRKRNDAARGMRQHLTHDEIEKILDVVRRATNTRHPLRDELMIILTYHHGLRPTELLNLCWEQIDIPRCEIDIERMKNGIDSTHTITCSHELKLMRSYHKLLNHPLTGPVFKSERGTVLTRSAFSKILNGYSLTALGQQWHISALRHACGMALAAQGTPVRTTQLYMGVRSIQHAAKYYS